MRYIIQKLVRTNRVIYTLWYKLWRSKTGDRVVLPKPGDRLYFDGYPRSGNTYLAGMIHYFFPDTIGSSHLHAIAPLKIALKNKVPCLIIIRNPRDCVASNHFRKTNGKFVNQDLLNAQLLEYVDYYEFVLKKINNLALVNFEDVISNPRGVLNKLNKQLQLNTGIEIDENQIREYDTFMMMKEKEKKAVSSSLPNEKRKTYKSKIVNLIESNPNYPRALKIYETLIQKV
jgi:hypothetical protein